MAMTGYHCGPAVHDKAGRPQHAKAFAMNQRMSARFAAARLLAVTAMVAAMPMQRLAAADASGGAVGETAAKGINAQRSALTVNLVSPLSGDWPQRLAANGNIAAWQEAVIGAEATGLRLTDVLVSVGDQVKRGQLLAKLKDDTLAAELAQTQASLVEAQAAAEEARANGDRARQMQSTGMVTAQQIQQWLTAEQTARARVDALKARLVAEQLRLAQTRVLAPDHGIISARAATVGAVVQPGQDLFRLIRGGRLEWRAEVPATELARIRPGTVVRVTPAGGMVIDGRVRLVAPTVDTQSRNGLVYVDLPSPGEARAGMFARGEFDLGATKALTLPQSAVVLRDGFPFVARVSEQSKVSLIKVATGRRVGDRVEIVSGLESNARVVASGGGFLSDGDTVRVVQGPPADVGVGKPAKP
jgi:RND family efflux transporter MFP subunit